MDRIECERHYKEEKGDRDQCKDSPAMGIDPGYIKESPSENKKFKSNRSKIDRQQEYGI